MTDDVCILKQQPKSLLYPSIFHQGKPIAIPYLENRLNLENQLTIGDFTRDHVEILQLLRSQVAISLETARLYRQVENHSHQLEAEIQQHIFDPLLPPSLLAVVPD